MIYKNKYIHLLTLAVVAAGGLAVVGADTTYAATYTFPVLGKSTFQDDFKGRRASGQHNAIDIIAGKHQKIVAAADGIITYVAYPQPKWGYMVRVLASNGYEYDYIHMNNDMPGTDNGKGGGMYAFAPGVRQGSPVKKGQLLGYVGDSGNSENTVSHLHFEVRKNGKTFNPYTLLRAASRIKTPVPAPRLASEIVPYGEKKYTLNVAVGDTQDDMVAETIIGVSKGDGPKVKVYNAAKQEIASFRPFSVGRYTDGIDVAVGDVDGDTKGEIIVGGREASGGRVAVYKRVGGGYTKLNEFSVYPGVNKIPRVSTADVDGNGTDEILVGAPQGQLPHVRVYGLNGTLIRSIAIYGDAFRGGIDVAGGDVSGDSKDEIVTSRLAEGSALIRIFDGMGTRLGPNYWAFESIKGGARVAVGNTVTNTPKSEIIVTANGAGPLVRVFNGTMTKLSERYFLENWWRGYYDVGASTGTIKTATGQTRRGSVQ